jgi:acetolactate decarboxylase
MIKRVQIILFSILIFSVSNAALNADDKETLMQVSTLDALVSGIYDGQMTLKELLTYGDTGLGTFQGLDGEMLVKDGVVYKIAYDGTVSVPDLSTLTPFAAVTVFDADITKTLAPDLVLADFPKTADASLPSVNLFYAIKIEGTFKKLKTRSVPKQTKKPYPPLAEVVKNQSVFEFENIEGTIIGLRCPPYVKGINSPGYHLHFISKDGKSGGHVLDFVVANASMKIDVTPGFRLIIPASQDFYNFDFTKDMTAETRQVLQQPTPQPK